jgi:hypothetical protein
MTTLEIILSISTFVFFIMWRNSRKIAKFYWERWDYFEGKYYSLYDAYIKKLTPKELMRVQDISRNRDKESWELYEPLEKPI